MLTNYYKPEKFEILRDFRIKRRRPDSLALEKAAGDQKNIETWKKEIEGIEIVQDSKSDIEKYPVQSEAIREKTEIVKKIGELVSQPKRNTIKELENIINKLNIYQLEDALQAGSELV